MDENSIVPDLNKKCQAIITSQIQICEPMSNGSWRLVTAFKDNFNIILDNRDIEKAIDEVVDNLSEIKKTWKDQSKIISLENLMNTKKQN